MQSEEKYKCDYVVYLHRNPITDMVFYVGMGNSKRPYDFKKRGILWNNYVNKYGKPKIDVYKTNLGIVEATYLESTLIKTFGRRRYEPYGILVNQKFGDRGLSGYKVSDETKKKISLAFAGENGRNTGRKHSEEARKNMSLAHKGKVWSEAMRYNFNKAVVSGAFKKRLPLSEETRDKIRQTLTGSKLSPESIEKRTNTFKLRRSNCKRVIDNKTGLVYNSISEAAQSRGISMKQLSKWLTGVIKIRKNEFSYYAEH